MPFDGMRMIYGGFDPVVEEGTPTSGGYVQGFIVPVPEGNKEVYRKMARDMWGIMKDYGAVRVVEAGRNRRARGQADRLLPRGQGRARRDRGLLIVEWYSRDAATPRMTR